MSRKSRRTRRTATRRRRSDINVQPLEQRTLLSATNAQNFADAEGDQTVRTQQEENLQRPEPGAVFAQLDANADGQLVAEELSEAAWMRISRADANDDSAVTLEELQQFRQENERDVQKPDPEQAHARLDANGDGSLTADEVAPPVWQRLSRADLNNDGAVTLEELQSARDADEDGVGRPEPGEAFQRLDANQDGVLTADEVSERAWAKISRADANGDDAVSAAELRLARQNDENNSRRPMTAQTFNRLDANDDGALTSDEVSEEAWNRLSGADANGDGAVTLEELRVARNRDEQDLRRPNTPAVFARLDANSDGRLTPDEVSEKGWDRLSQADLNNDGAVTPHEIAISRERDERNLEHPGPGDFFDRLDANEDGALTPDEVSPQTWNMKLAPADGNSDGAVTLEELRAHSFARTDDNNDGFITPDEVTPEQWRRLRRADANRDGRVTREEMQAGAHGPERDVQKPGNAEAFDRLDQNDDGQLTADEVSDRAWMKISRADANADNAVTLAELQAGRAGNEDDVRDPQPENPFRLLDANDDGRLTADEVSAEAWARISGADANGDNAVTIEELRAARRADEDDAGRPGRGEAFARLDADSDGELTADEVREDVWARLSAADADGNGGVTAAELMAAHEAAEAEARRRRPGRAFERLDSNDDGRLTEDEVSQQLWDRLSEADANADGGVTRHELRRARMQDEDDVRRPGAAQAFQRLDANNDGALTVDEVSEDAWARLSRADANDDGAVTLQEIAQARGDDEDDVDRPGPRDIFRRLDANDDRQLTQDEVSPEAWARISQADANSDGAVTLQELHEQRREREQNVRRPSPQDVFDRLDANSDGQLTEDEVTGDAWARLSEADADGNGGVTLNELRAARMDREDRVQRPSPAEVFARLDVNEDGQLTADEVSEEIWAKLSRADANQDGAVTVPELRQHREDREDRVQRPNPAEVFARLDVNEDGQLTADEVSEEIWAKLSRADANQDGAVTISELRQHREDREDRVQRPSPAEVFARLDVNEDGQLTADEVSEEVWAKLSRADANQDGAVTIPELRQHREDREDRVQRPNPAEVFARLDVNEDGQLTADEVSEEIWAKLSRADANQDGAVTIPELRQYREDREDRVQRPSPAEVFARLDVNEDGQLTADEVSEEVWAKLSRADANQDGAVTVPELRQHREDREDRVQRPSPAEVFARLDVNEDGQLTADEVSEEVWAKLSRADANQDGAVTISELRQHREDREDRVQRPSPAEVFARLDVNEDGQLTADEVSEEVWAKLSRADANQDGAVTVPELRQYREDREDRVQRPSPAEVFARLDVNEDGQLTADEVSEEVWAKLSRADANQDGAVTVPELRQHREDREDRVQRPSPGEVFANLDVNEDGQLTADEVSGDVWAKISQADANSDGGVTQAELRAAREDREDRVQRPNPADVFATLDVNGDGALTADEVSEGVWAKISRADSDNDGNVTQAELRAAREAHEDRVQRPNPGEAFNRLDVNADGSLTADEVNAEVWSKVSRADANEDGAVTAEELQMAHADRRRQLRWTAGSGASTYEVWINDANTNSLVMREAGLNGTDFSVLNLDDGDYYFWIQDEQADGQGAWRTRTEFSVVNGEVAVAASVGTLQWDAISGALTYEVWISSAETRQRVDRAAGLEGTSYELPALADGNYFYWIQAEGADGGGNWTRRQSFTVQDGQLLTSPGTLTWNAIDGAVTYEVWINAGGTRQLVARKSGLTETEFALPGLADGTYDYWIQAENENGHGSWGSRQSFAVENGAVVQLTPVGTISWQADASAVSYEVWINDASTGQRVARQAGLTETSFEVPYLQDGRYHYWIQNEGANGRGPWSERREFVVSNGQIRASVSPGTLTWPVDTGAVTYELWVSEAGGTSRPVFRAEGLTSSEYQLPVLADGDYDYWVQSEDENGNGRWSRRQVFRIENGQLSVVSASQPEVLDAVIAELAVTGLAD